MLAALPRSSPVPPEPSQPFRETKHYLISENLVKRAIWQYELDHSTHFRQGMAGSAGHIGSSQQQGSNFERELLFMYWQVPFATVGVGQTGLKTV